MQTQDLTQEIILQYPTLALGHVSQAIPAYLPQLIIGTEQTPVAGLD